MRFPVYFSRVVDGIADTLGTDTLPTGPAAATSQNLVTFPPFLGDWPIHRLGVVVKAPATVTAIPVSLYTFEESTQTWNLIGDRPKLVRPGVLQFFDVPTLGKVSPVPGGNSSLGGVDVLVIAAKVTGAPNGTYEFAIAPLLTSMGEDSTPGPTDPAVAVFPVTPNDATDLTYGACRALLIEDGGDVAIIPAAGAVASPVVLTCDPGTLLRIQVRRVMAAGTTATQIHALY
jgi:hypothetical protein